MKTHQNKLKSNKIIEGIITISHRGLGNVRTNKDEVIEIEHNFLRTACHGDIVKVILHPRRTSGNLTGEVLEILRRSKKGYSGIIERESNTYFLIPSDPRMYTDIIIPENKLSGATVGQKVFVVITNWKDYKKAPLGKVEKILGLPMENNAEMEGIALEKGFNSSFPGEVVSEAINIKNRGIRDIDFKGRKDMRNVTTFTIDPVDAKDFDDAISVKRLFNGNYEIGIHIADVSHYVKPKTALDNEAKSRGTSVYLVDRTIPMLPHELSNDLCSLNPSVDRLTFSVIFEMDINGKIHNKWFGETIIHSDKRFTYENAQKILNDKKGLFYEELNILNTIAKKLLKKRFEEGAIILEQEEVKFRLDENGVPVSVYTKTRLDTNKLIEEFMLLANRHMAEIMSNKNKNKKNDGVFVYRIHGLPNKEKMKDLASFLKHLGYHLKLKDGIIPSEEINALIIKLENNPLRDTVHTAVIRTMAKAIYSTKNIGHYGLGFKFYTHFTSPIRRYPDIIVHRLLKDFLNKEIIHKGKLFEYEKLSQEASIQEKEAAEAERASIKYKQVEYMSNHIGYKYNGIITGVTEWGLYIEESETKCEGMVKIKNLKDYYIFDKKYMSIRGQKTHKKYTLGDSVKFKVVEADINKKTIDYELI